MQQQTQEDAREVASVVSDLSALEHDADDFDRLMIQHARDERRLSEARHGRVQAFRKARTHPRVGLTMDNLERNTARHDAAPATSARAQLQSPPSSSGSTRSDPTVHAPASWGRKGRPNRNWMRTIPHAEEQQRTPEAADDTIHGQADDGANVPRRSVEDSPLSHKSSVQGTPQHDRSQDWDLTFELNEASMIASTPYIPRTRNTALDDIRQREIESLEEQVVATARVEAVQEGSPEHVRRPRSSAAKTTDGANSGTSPSKQPAPEVASLEKRLHTRTKSWQSIGKSQPVTGTGKEKSPMALYKSAENVVAVEYNAIATAQPSPPVRAPYRREDSQDLLRRLARVSNTPSPARVVAARPQSAPVRPPNSSSQTGAETTTTASPDNKYLAREKPTEPASTKLPSTDADVKSSETQRVTVSTESLAQPETEAEDVDATPAPIERSILNPKTPVVTGAWVDTPGPRTARKFDTRSRSPSKSPRKRSPRRSEPSEQVVATGATERPEADAIEAVRPSLPSSALQALVQEAKASGRRSSADYGDSTINSLEELITPLPEGTDVEPEDDTLQGIQLPTSTPRNEAERRRQQEAQQLHSMNAKLRAARTSIRHASRGMQRVEERVEHVEEDVGTVRTKAITNIHQHEVTLWSLVKNTFWHEPTRLERQQSRSRWKVFGGLTPFSILLLCLVTWGVAEMLACDQFCQPQYARSSNRAFAVDPNAPEFPFVIPTLTFRTLIGPWLPSSLLSLLWWFITTIGTWFSDLTSWTSRRTVLDHQPILKGMDYSATAQSYWASSTQIVEDADWGSMMDDQAI
ncbi:hypothetical protein ACN47E_005701 [Coniothyrium glycines]